MLEQRVRDSVKYIFVSLPANETSSLPSKVIERFSHSMFSFHDDEKHSQNLSRERKRKIQLIFFLFIIIERKRVDVCGSNRLDID